MTGTSLRSSRAARGVLAALLVILSAAAVHAQGGPSSSAGRNKYGKFRLGPLYLTPSLTVVAGVDNNVYNSPTGIADQSVLVTPKLDAVLPVTRHARLKGSIGVLPQYFYREASQRHTDVFGSGLAEVDVGPITGFGGLAGGRYQERFSLEIDDRILRHEKGTLFGARIHFGPRITAAASQNSVRTTFDPEATFEGDSVSQALDRTTVTRQVRLTIPLTRKTSLAPYADFVEDRFAHSQDGLPSVVRSQRYAAVFEFSDLAFINGHIGGGLRHFDAHDGVPPYDGAFLDVAASAPLFAGARIVVSSDRDVTYSAFDASLIGLPADAHIRDTFVRSVYRVEVSFELPWKMHGRAFASYGESKYLPPEGGDIARRDHGWLEGGALLRRFGSRVSLGGIVQHEDRHSFQVERNYDRMVYGVTGEVRF